MSIDRGGSQLGGPVGEGPNPAMTQGELVLDEAERRHAAGLMRINHVGEICAQALYDAQALATDSARLREAFQQAAQEETDHLAWTQNRIEQLGGRTSLLNPLWYSGAFAIGFVAAKLGDRTSLGFMAETERQVEQHLDSHLGRLPESDIASRAALAGLPVLRKYGVVPLPQLLDVGYRDVRTSRDKPAREVTVRVRYRFVGPAGDHLDVEVPGEAMDHGDKGTAKAMSVAMRIALLQALCLPTDEPDADTGSYERAHDERREPVDEAARAEHSGDRTGAAPGAAAGAGTAHQVRPPGPAVPQDGVE